VLFVGDKKQVDLFLQGATRVNSDLTKQACSSKKSPKPARSFQAAQPLSIRFRSSSAILQLVDTTLAPHTDQCFRQTPRA